MKIADCLGLNNKLILPGKVNDHMVVTRPKDMSMEVSKFEETFQFKANGGQDSRSLSGTFGWQRFFSLI